ncbi:hypothetical protein [Arthrobacter glacialis]|uniref:hypothetical protein n=1 Tax=Arthrobacter glacialis TaxID=1664 RepID=UPI001057142E|nr:hypothetical protein [Arthrobacter glacialis]
MTNTRLGSAEASAASPAQANDAVVEELSENESPLPGSFSVPTAIVPPTHRERTQKLLAMIIVCVLLALYVAVVARFLCTEMDTDRLIAVVAALSGLQALAAAAVGFYYGSQAGDNK